mmetsp:Transcript_22482/g.45064  ORF Transcript_22482/g.45064 Transcript_22482/m.45064 type:complete len:205 (+) Transcript_22482:876-1490(+)
MWPAGTWIWQSIRDPLCLRSPATVVRRGLEPAGIYSPPTLRNDPDVSSATAAGSSGTCPLRIASAGGPSRSWRPCRRSSCRRCDRTLPRQTLPPYRRCSGRREVGNNIVLLSRAGLRYPRPRSILRGDHAEVLPTDETRQLPAAAQPLRLPKNQPRTRQRRILPRYVCSRPTRPLSLYASDKGAGTARGDPESRRSQFLRNESS